MSIFIKSFLFWLLIIPLAIANGALRNLVLSPAIGSYALPVSGIILSGLILLTAFFCVPHLSIRTAGQALRTGIFWVIFTISFEFMFGLLSGASFAALLQAYDLRTGNLWLLVVIITGLAPFVAAKIRKII